MTFRQIKDGKSIDLGGLLTVVDQLSISTFTRAIYDSGRRAVTPVWRGPKMRRK